LWPFSETNAAATRNSQKAAAWRGPGRVSIVETREITPYLLGVSGQGSGEGAVYARRILTIILAVAKVKLKAERSYLQIIAAPSSAVTG
jgi:hypothetical protein